MSGYFSTDYKAARQAFLNQALEVKGIAWQASFKHPCLGAQGEELALDAVWMGDLNASKLLIVQSATHGIEGFAGSAIQTAWLTEAGLKQLPEDTAILFLHAMNPWGFSFLRRVDEAGIDLNRNFIDFTAVPDNKGYEVLNALLIPTAWQPEVLSTADSKLAAYQAAWGERLYEEAVSGGQYTHPQGLFYGGKEPSWSRSVLTQLATDLQLAERKAVAIIDVHTGLGDYSVGEVICDHPPNSLGVSWAKRWYGAAVTEPFLGTSSSVPKLGLIDYFWHQTLPDACCFITLEFGTGSTENLFNVLRADHWLAGQATKDLDKTLQQKIQQDLLTHFYPTDKTWQQAVLKQGLERINQALEGLQQV
ncbi:M14 family metallopeptidase [Marinospirillum minutulum]|uniref:M14 family metallopeptidase n=1 Tax=Marinospirillum minutulum TaxID=64974 RepID=UPI00040BF24D|nr:M14 family metallopeptidase [Marinospirillum minutulum]